MGDMLVKLYELPECSELIQSLKNKGIFIKRAIGPEKRLLEEWCSTAFTEHASGEISVAMSRIPSGVFVAVRNGKPIGGIQRKGDRQSVTGKNSPGYVRGGLRICRYRKCRAKRLLY